MSLAYRAIWQDDRQDLIGFGFAEFAEWAYDRYRISAIRPGDAEHVHEGVHISTSVVEANDELNKVMSAKLRADSGDERWVITLLVIESSEGNWVWVDVERVAADIWTQVTVNPPGFAAALLNSGRRSGGDPRWGDVRLDGRALVVRPGTAEATCANLIMSAGRECPVVVVAHDYEGGAKATIECGEATAKQLAGIAPVKVLPDIVIDEFNEALPEDFAINPGEVRLYLPGKLPARFHYTVEPEVARSHPGAAGRRIARRVMSILAARRAPAIYDRLRPLLRKNRGLSSDELLSEAFKENDELRSSIDELEQAVDQLEGEKLDTLSDIETLQAQVIMLQQALLHGNELPAKGQRPAKVSGVGDAITQARRHLAHLSIPEGIERDVDKLDRVVEQASWGNTLWHGLQALDAYASDPLLVPGGFYEWCKKSGHAFTWPATAKKVAMKESETVMSSERFRSKRNLPVSKDLDKGGRREMFSHLKISEGGGPLAPRVYFYDDTAGKTAKVHVGYIGPHAYMPNGSTN